LKGASTVRRGEVRTVLAMATRWPLPYKVLGYSAAQFGVIVSVYGLALAASPMLLGRISEVFPKKLLIPTLSTIYLGATAEQNRSQLMGIRGTAISLGTLLGPLAQALASPWITPQLTFAIGIALSFVITLLAFVVLKPRFTRESELSYRKGET
jgi:MFS family permease